MRTLEGVKTAENFASPEKNCGGWSKKKKKSGAFDKRPESGLPRVDSYKTGPHKRWLMLPSLIQNRWGLSKSCNAGKPNCRRLSLTDGLEWTRGWVGAAAVRAAGILWHGMEQVGRSKARNKKMRHIHTSVWGCWEDRLILHGDFLSAEDEPHFSIIQRRSVDFGG